MFTIQSTLHPHPIFNHPLFFFKFSISFAPPLTSNPGSALAIDIPCWYTGSLFTWGQFWPFGYCHCLCLCLCVCVCVSLCVNHLLVHAITRDPCKLGSPNLNQKCKQPWLRSLLFWGDWLWTSRSNLTSESKFTQFLACPHDNSSPVQARTTKFGPKVQNTLVNIPDVLRVDWSWQVKFNLISKSCLFASPFCALEIFVWQAKTVFELFHIPHGSTQYADSLMHAGRVAPWTMNQSRVVRPSGHWLSDLHWILQDAIRFLQIICTSHAKILYANIWQLPKQQ